MPLYKVETTDHEEYYVQAMNAKCAVQVVLQNKGKKTTGRTSFPEINRQYHHKCTLIKPLIEPIKVCDDCGVRRPVSESSRGAFCQKCHEKHRKMKTAYIR